MTTVTAPRRAGVLESLSVVLPCFNEEPNVEHAIAEAHRAGQRFARDYEILVVDDGSTDRTRAIAAGTGDPRVRVLHHERNRGYGAAVRKGLQASTCAWVLLTDGDLQFDLAELEGFVPLAEGHELVAGFRIDRADPALRRASARAWNLLVDATFGVTVRDVDCAFKLMRGSAVRELRLASDGAMVSTELLVRARQAGWRIAELGVSHRPRTAGQSSGGDPRVVARAFQERRALKRRLRAERRGPRPSLRPRVT